MIFDGLIKRIIQKKVGKYSAKVTAIKGAEPVVVIGAVAGIIVAVCKAVGIEIDEKAIEAIAAGAVAAYGVYKAISNWLKNMGK